MPARNRVPARIKPAILELDGARCVYCSRRVVADDITLEHLIPRFYGGPDAYWNLAIACFSCNSAKQHRFNEDAARVLIGNLTYTLIERTQEVGWDESDRWQAARAQQEAN